MSLALRVGGSRPGTLPTLNPIRQFGRLRCVLTVLSDAAKAHTTKQPPTMKPGRAVYNQPRSPQLLMANLETRKSLPPYALISNT